MIINYQYSLYSAKLPLKNKKIDLNKANAFFYKNGFKVVFKELQDFEKYGFKRLDLTIDYYKLQVYANGSIIIHVKDETKDHSNVLLLLNLIEKIIIKNYLLKQI